MLFEKRSSQEYGAGIGLDIGKPKTKKKRRTIDKCKCGSTTHKTSRSKQCPLNRANKAATTVDVAAAAPDIENTQQEGNNSTSTNNIGGTAVLKPPPTGIDYCKFI